MTNINLTVFNYLILVWYKRITYLVFLVCRACPRVVCSLSRVSARRKFASLRISRANYITYLFENC